MVIYKCIKSCSSYGIANFTEGCNYEFEFVEPMNSDKEKIIKIVFNIHRWTIADREIMMNFIDISEHRNKLIEKILE